MQNFYDAASISITIMVSEEVAVTLVIGEGKAGEVTLSIIVDFDNIDVYGGGVSTGEGWVYVPHA